MKRKEIFGIMIAAVLASSVYMSPAHSQALYEVRRLPFNTDEYNEIVPVIVNGGLIYCSDRRYSGFLDRTSFDGSRLYNQYYAAGSDSVWQAPEIVRSDRSYLFTNGPASVTADGTTIYFTSDVETGKAAEKSTFRNKLGIFRARLEGNQVNSIEPFRYNSLNYNIVHPSISSDGQRIYFASDMKGGRGRTDIYYCELVNGEWADPVSLGPAVNTASRESYPFIHPSGKLYFASNRAGGAGQLDIYVTEYRDGQWLLPYRMPEPVNSRFDDFALTASADRKSGFFTSSRQRGSDDIFSFRSNIVRKERCDSLQENIYWYNWVDPRSSLNDSIPYTYEWDFGDGEKGQGPDVWHLYPGPGKYVVRLDLINQITNEITTYEGTLIADVVQIEQAYITSPDTVNTGVPLSLSANETYLPDWEISSYYWNFDNEEVAIGSDVTARYLSPGVYNVQLIVTGKPDASGKPRETCVTKKITVLRQP